MSNDHSFLKSYGPSFSFILLSFTFLSANLPSLFCTFTFPVLAFLIYPFPSICSSFSSQSSPIPPKLPCPYFTYSLNTPFPTYPPIPSPSLPFHSLFSALTLFLYFSFLIFLSFSPFFFSFSFLLFIHFSWKLNNGLFLSIYLNILEYIIHYWAILEYKMEIFYYNGLSKQYWSIRIYLWVN